MKLNDVKIGTEVVRSKGDYVVGRVGKVVEIDAEKGRVRVEWEESGRTWVKVEVIEPTEIPYEIKTFYEDKYRSKKTGRYPYPKYTRK